MWSKSDAGSGKSRALAFDFRLPTTPS
jgi:hypothetical protein